MSYPQGIFETLAWLTKKYKQLCCAIDQLRLSGAGSYRVYTALLTQSGGDGPNSFGSGTPLVIGTTYKILDAGIPSGDWTNVGSPNNLNDTYFVATGTTPNSWGDGGQVAYNTGAPVATVLDNTIGNIYFTYYEPGDYFANLLNGFPYDKTTVFMQGQNFIQVVNNLDYIEMVTRDSTGTLNDDLLDNTPIEIRVYS